MVHEQNPSRAPDDEDVDPEIVPEDAPRGGITVPDANDTGTTTPPIGGWGDTVAGDGVEDEADERGD